MEVEKKSFGKLYSFLDCGVYFWACIYYIIRQHEIFFSSSGKFPMMGLHVCFVGILY